MIAVMDVILGEAAVLIEIQMNKDGISINTTTEPTIFLSIVERGLVNHHGHEW